jgi:molybdenum cofactor biosynthesis enzyme MoaA
VTVQLRPRLRRLLAPYLHHNRRVWRLFADTDERLERARQSLALHIPQLVRAAPRQLQIAVTAHCNLRCIGCRYGRDFMTGAQLPWHVVRDLLDDARDLGLWEIRLYGGEPLLHPDLPRMVEHTIKLGMEPFVTTNGILLAQKFDVLHAAGLRRLTIGFYGVGDAYDSYVQRRDRFAHLERGIASIRERYGDTVDIRINWLLMRLSCSSAALDEVCRFAERYGLRIQVDLVHYSLPYFTEGPDRALQFRAEDTPALQEVVEDLIRRKDADPHLFFHSPLALRSIPDWLLLGPEMRVPCDARKMLWVGADGTVQLCYVTFRLGNLHEQRLRDMVFTPEHHQAAQAAFALRCPNCHCGYDRRTELHAPAAARYTQLLRQTRR